MNLSRLRVVYFTQTFVNSNNTADVDTVLNTDGTMALAQIQTNFLSPIIQRADEWILSVERFELNLNGVPYYDAAYNESIDIYDTATDTLQQAIALTTTVYSIPEFIDVLNELITTAGGLAVANNMSFEIDQNGYITLNFTDLVNYYLVIPDRANQILGLEATGINAAGGYWSSTYPRFDMGDEIDHVRLISNLELVSDTVGQTRTNIVTDLGTSSSINASQSANVAAPNPSFSYSQRQKLVYNPYQRRWLNFAAPIPIQNLRIIAEYVRTDGSSSPIYLPRGGIFSIKLGFYFRA